jgi:hypothetical protein
VTASSRKHFEKTFPRLLLIAIFLGTFISLSPTHSFALRAYAEIPSTYSGTQQSSIVINMTSGVILRVLVPSSSNISVLSLSGGQYDAGMYTAGTKNEFLFTPAQVANYSLVLNVSSTSPTTINLTQIGDSPSTWSKNITSDMDDQILKISMSVLPQPPASQSSGWNPLFGFTGISLGGVTLNSTDVLGIFAAFSIFLMAVGIKRSQKLLYAGLFFLSLIGMIVVGILVVALVAGSYLAGFLIIRSYFGYKAHRQGKI